uniref:Uncharacterized protein n=1 Tax=Physcomitrium patens TaxID=3218 RepID=A9RSJ2_PHYPA|nr:hypothetical protein PHYPA_004553 [Physcomitrium patens]
MTDPVNLHNRERVFDVDAAMTTEQVPHYGGWSLEVVAICSRCAVDLFEATACVFQHCSASLAVAHEKIVRWVQRSSPTPPAGLWDIDAGLHGPALKRSEMSEIFPALVL